MEIIYQKETQNEGKDCLINDANCIIELASGCYLAVKSTVYQGYMGTDTRSQSCIFDNKPEALNYIQGDK